LAHHHNQNDGAETGDGTHLNQRAKPTKSLPGTVDGQGDRGGYGKFLEGNNSGEDKGDEDVEDGADQQRAEDSFRHIALGVAGFLGGSGDGVEADIGEEDHSCSGENAAPPVFPEASSILRNEGNPVVGVDVGRTAENKENDNRKFDDHDGIVEICGFTNANDEESRNG